MALGRSDICSGFREDCEKIISRFEQASDIRFETFCEIWKDMKFALIFSGRPSFIELLEFCEESLHICKQFLLSRSRFKERIGGLYLLYGVYYKMPVDEFKIRITLKDWQSIMELHAEIKEAEHLDANYILCKLIVDNAFHFCMFDREFGMEKHYRLKDSESFNQHSVLPLLKDLTEENQLLSSINELSKLYEERKKAFISRTKSDASLNLFNAKIAEEIINDIQDFETNRKNEQLSVAQCSVVDNEQASEASTSKETQKSSHKLASIRRTKRIKALLETGYDSDSPLSEDDELIDLADCDSDLSENSD